MTAEASNRGGDPVVEEHDAGASGEIKIANTLHVVTDGEPAMAFLRVEGPFLFGPRPDLVLLDAVKLAIHANSVRNRPRILHDNSATHRKLLVRHR